MTIQNINLGALPLGVGGDSFRSASQKINDNFNSADHAASKTVGISAGQVPLAEQTLAASNSIKPIFISTGSGFNLDNCVVGQPYLAERLVGSNIVNAPSNFGTYFIDTKRSGYDGNGRIQTALGSALWIRHGSMSAYGEWVQVGGANGNNSGLGSAGRVVQYTQSTAKGLVDALLQTGSQFFRVFDSPNPATFDYAAGIFSQANDTYMGIVADYNSTKIKVFSGISSNTGATIIRDLKHTGNTTVDSNGFLKNASPIVQVYSDKIELNDDAKQQDIEFTKNGIGDYNISGTSGLSTDGWYIELPIDMNGNPKVAVTLEETDGVITLKCYKRVFSMQTFTFGPDLDSPMDVPDGRWIDIRLVELEPKPVEINNEDI